MLPRRRPVVRFSVFLFYLDKGTNTKAQKTAKESAAAEEAVGDKVIYLLY
jgi:hypothetical protein